MNIRFLRFIICSLVVLVFSSVCFAQTSAENALIRADQDWLKVFAAKDLASVDHCLDDGSVMAPNFPAANGKDQIKQLFTGFFAIPGFKITWTPNKTSVSGNMGVTSGVYEMSVNGPDGKPQNDTGKYVTVWKKDKAGKWKVWLDMFNSDKPA